MRDNGKNLRRALRTRSLESTSLLRPHLKLLPELQVDVVHLGDGNVVVLSLLLVQQLVPERDKNNVHYFFFMTLVFWRSALCQLSDDLKHPVQYAEKHTCSVAQGLPIWQHTYLYFHCPISFICYSAHILCPDPSCSSL